MSRTHGLASTYRNTPCRCDDCRKANTERSTSDRRVRAERLVADPSLVPHGIRSTYANWGCRCEPCTEANKQVCRDYHAQRRALLKEGR